jgi:glycosyltransferase involved in cell wall biosynthesis
MLGEAIESVLSQSFEDLRCIVYDDGSDSFDFMEYISQYDDPRIMAAAGDQMTPEERTRAGNTQWSTNMNYLLSKLPREDALVYLCDDDILAPFWLDVINYRFNLEPNLHLLMGDMAYFQDGQDPLTEGIRGFPVQKAPDEPPPNEAGFMMWWSLGAFAHRMTCFFDEGVRWRKGYKNHAHSWDIAYIEQIQALHPYYEFIPQITVYRREHANTMSAKLGRINENGLYYRAGEEIPEDAVTTPME